MSDTLGTTPRRVLGSLAVNTPTTASKLRNPLSASHKPIPISPLGPLCSPPRVGQKRSIDQVEGASPRSAARRDSPPQTEARESTIQVYEDVQMTPELMKCKTSCLIPATTSSCLTQTPLPDSNDGANQAASQDTVVDSISSVIDLDPDNESVSSTQTAPTEPPTPGQSTVRLRAETLRLRLRVAMFKINTHQTNIPLSRLQISPKKLVHSPAQTQKTPPPQEAVALPKAQTPMKPTISKLLPAPILIPTAYSARLIHHRLTPSSPLSSFSSSGSQDTPSPGLATAALPQQRRSHPPSQVDSPRGGQERPEQKTKAVDLDANLPSSVIKGRAASGLLNLMNMG